MSGPDNEICRMSVLVPGGATKNFVVGRSEDGNLIVSVGDLTGASVTLREGEYAVLRMLFEDIGGNTPKRWGRANS